MEKITKSPKAEQDESGISDCNLVEIAFSMLSVSYAPYSDFRLGAALLCKDGTVYTGCNIENAAYGDSVCAERTALFKAVTEGHRDDFVKLAIAAESDNYCMPCGTCRQVLSEFAPNLKILAANKRREFCEYNLAELLPGAFGPRTIK